MERLLCCSSLERQPPGNSCRCLQTAAWRDQVWSPIGGDKRSSVGRRDRGIFGSVRVTAWRSYRLREPYAAPERPVGLQQYGCRRTDQPQTDVDGRMLPPSVSVTRSLRPPGRRLRPPTVHPTIRSTAGIADGSTHDHVLRAVANDRCPRAAKSWKPACALKSADEAPRRSRAGVARPPAGRAAGTSGTVSDIALCP